jgi:hypothetical protein
MPVPDQVRPGDIWPTELQQLLLQAALLPAERAVPAWRTWRAAVDPQRLDAGSHRILPLLYHNLRAYGVDDPSLSYYKAAYRQTWYKNNTLFYQMSSVLAALRAAGLAVMVLKGVPLAIQYYHDIGLRPMGDFDLLVRTADMPRTVAVLAEHGWTSDEQETIPPGFLDIQQSGSFGTADGRHFDLHWHVLWDHTAPDADVAFWDQAGPLEVHHQPVLALSPTDQLLHVCIHGARYDFIPPMRWMADAYYICQRAGDQIDWARMLTHAEQRRLVLPLRDTLSLLAAVLDVPVPAEVLRTLSALPVTDRERHYYQVRTRRPGLLGYFPMEWDRYQALAIMAGQPPSAWGFVRYMRLSWKLSHPAQIPGRMLAKAWKRLNQRARGQARATPG